MIWDSVNCCFHNFLMDPGFSRFKISFTDHDGLSSPSLSLPPSYHMSEPSPRERTEQGPDVDWPALTIAIDEMNAALALVRGGSHHNPPISLNLPPLTAVHREF